MQKDSNGGHSVRQTDSQGVTQEQGQPRSPSQSTANAFPVLLTDVQSAACLGVSIRKFHDLRSASWMPRPVALGPRLLRWPRAELERAVAGMPRQEVPAAEPLQLAKGRAARAIQTEVR